MNATWLQKMEGQKDNGYISTLLGDKKELLKILEQGNVTSQLVAEED